MKSLIIYGAQTKLTNAHKLVTNTKSGPLATQQPPYFVRVKTSSLGYIEALGHAKPMPGETVLNTVPIE